MRCWRSRKYFFKQGRQMRCPRLLKLYSPLHFGQCVFSALRFAGAKLPAACVFCLDVKIRKWSGLTQLRSRHIWSTTIWRGIGSLYISYEILCAFLELPSNQKIPYPLSHMWLVQSQHPDSGIRSTFSSKRCSKDILPSLGRQLRPEVSGNQRYREVLCKHRVVRWLRWFYIRIWHNHLHSVPAIQG